MILHGDSLEILRTLDADSVDAVVTDAPYGLSFMGKKWDYDVPTVELWLEVLRVMKPGSHLLSFGGTRTYHRMVVAIEDAGFEIRDQLQWIFGSGFPKSHDVSKGIDKAAGAEREVVGSMKAKLPTSNAKFATDEWSIAAGKMRDIPLTAPATDAAKRWQGFGTALKPANEPIVLARKPLSESTVAKNVLKWGTGALNVDASRIASGPDHAANCARTFQSGIWAKSGEGKAEITTTANDQGRWPANCLFDESAAQMLDEQSGTLKKGGMQRGSTYRSAGSENIAMSGKNYPRTKESNIAQCDGDYGASRFFYVAKASKRERNAGLEMPPEGYEIDGAILNQDASDNPNTSGRKENPIDRISQNRKLHKVGNFHPTVKPIKLMEYLCRLICPPGGTILDCFAGSGSTGVAAKRLGFEFVGIEREKEYCEIAEKRIAHACRESEPEQDPAQLDMFEGAK